MSTPKTRVYISSKGDSRIEVLEQSDQCHKLSDIAKAAGRVIKEEETDHAPAYQDINYKGA